MTQNVVISVGQRSASVDDEDLTERERDAQDHLFGGLYHGTRGESSVSCSQGGREQEGLTSPGPVTAVCGPTARRLGSY